MDDLTLTPQYEVAVARAVSLLFGPPEELATLNARSLPRARTPPDEAPAHSLAEAYGLMT